MNLNTVFGPSNGLSFFPTQRTDMTREQLLERERDHYRARVEESQLGAVAFATLALVEDRTILVISGPSIIRVAKPSYPNLEPGMLLSINQTTGIPHGVLEDSPIAGDMATVVGMHGTRAEVSLGATQPLRSVLCRKKYDPKPGDRVVLSPDGQAIVQNLGPAKSAKPTVDPGVSWDDIFGLEDIKRKVRAAVEDRFLHPELLKKYDQTPTRGMLFTGSPGGGKTLLGKAVATSLAKMHGKEAAAGGFRYVKGPEMLSKWTGEAESGLRTIFEEARAYERDHGYPAVVFFDEADALFRERGKSLHEGPEATLVPAMLTELDGFDETGPLVILATNRPKLLDPAIVRPKRIGRKFHFPRCTKAEAVNAIASLLRGKPLAVDKANPEKVAELAEETVDRIFYGGVSSLYHTITFADGTTAVFGHMDVVSFALCVDVVDRAVAIAIEREKAGGEEGITLADLFAAVDDSAAEERLTDHTGAVFEQFGEHRQITNIGPPPAPSAEEEAA